MSNSAPSSLTSKNAYVPAQGQTASQFQTGFPPTTNSHPQRREGGTGSFGASLAQRSTCSTARNSQSLRKHHKGQRRPRLADEDANAESAAMQSTNSRKGRTSITHLMNFTLPPRPQNSQQQPYFGRNSRKNPTWGLGSGYHAADKARYINANYRFLVTPKGDYRAQSIDPDFHLDWSNVLQILVSAQSQSTNCPICLSTPVVPRMAKCGHLFCLSCLIRFMHSTDDTNPTPEKKARWKKCPICWDSIYISETRPVRWFVGQEGERPQEGGDVFLRLIKRQAGSTLALPRDGAEALENGEDVPWYFAAEVMDYARIMKASEEYMVEQHEFEVEQLWQLEKEDVYGEDTQWIRKAVASVKDAKERVKGIGNPPSVPKQPNERKARRPPIEFHVNGETTPEFHEIQRSANSGQSTAQSPYPSQLQRSESVQERSTPMNTSGSTDEILAATDTPSFRSQSSQPILEPLPSSNTRHKRDDSPFFFYEGLLHYYLSPLDIRILRSAFGDYAKFPSAILLRVEHVSTGHIVDDELRRRAKYLAHLPQGCEVAFLECDLTDVVPTDIFDTFAGDIDRRRRKNREKEIREEKERVRAEREEDNKGWAAARRRRPIPMKDLVSEDEFQPLPQASPPEPGAVSSSPLWTSAKPGGSAFASLASPSTSPAAAKTVWGTRIVPPVSPDLAAEVHGLEMSENDGWLQDWEQDLLHEEELATHLDDISMEPGSSKQAGMTATTGKKKKNKKITLMTTNARRGA